MQKETFPLDDEQYKDLIEIDEIETSSSERKKLISDEELIGIKASVTKLMVEKEVFLDSDLNLIKMAELLNISPHQLSYVINTGFNENFYQFINKYRVEKTKELLIKKEMDNLSILGIAYESGFNSKTSFYAVFKKITGITPSEFKKRSSSL
jgi:AraC-like DNA-binding protein